MKRGRSEMSATVGGRIRDLRYRRGMPQEELGEKLFMRKSTTSDYENDVIDILFLKRALSDLTL